MDACKSPLTGGWEDANCGGNLTPAIKRCGVDTTLFKGIADAPVYLYLDKKGPQLKSADHPWGLDAIEAENQLIKENTGNKTPVVSTIGPAGEKLSLKKDRCLIIGFAWHAPTAFQPAPRVACPAIKQD